MIYKHKMLKLSLGILFIIALFEPTIQQYSDAYCAKYVATFINISDANNESSIIYKMIESFPNNNCSGPETFTLTYSPNVCKNNMILTYDYPTIPPILPKIPAKKENWNEYIVLSGSNFASSVKSIKILKEIAKYIDFPQLVLSELLIGFSAFLFTFTFFISLVQ